MTMTAALSSYINRRYENNELQVSSREDEFTDIFVFQVKGNQLTVQSYLDILQATDERVAYAVEAAVSELQRRATQVYGLEPFMLKRMDDAAKVAVEQYRANVQQKIAALKHSSMSGTVADDAALAVLTRLQAEI